MVQLTLAKVEDHEGTGDCSECGRQGLRWIARLSDGSGVGFECAKKILGFRPVAKDFVWQAYYSPVAEHREGADVFVLWQAIGTEVYEGQSRETLNGLLFKVGGVSTEWLARGWM